MTDPELAYAGGVSRGIAFAIDVSASTIVATVGAVLARVSAQALGLDTSGGGALAVAYLLSVPLVFALYCVGFWSLSGRTPGMAVLGLRVVRSSGDPVGPGRALVRVAGYTLSAVLLIGFVMILVDRRRQGLHDKLAGTVVVYDTVDHVEPPVAIPGDAVSD